MAPPSLTILVAMALLPRPAPLEVVPAEIGLRGSDSRAQIVVTGRDARGTPRDLTHDAAVTYESLDPRTAVIDGAGQIHPMHDGRARIRVRQGVHSTVLNVTVEDYADHRPVSFTTEVVPIFTKLGCNGGTCHGKSSGQNGFRLSLLGFDPALDHDSLTRDGRGRRVFPAAPEASLMLLKPTAAIAHGGGRRLASGSPEYRTIARWISQGVRFPEGDELPFTRIAVWPEQRVLQPDRTQQIRVVAHQADGSTVDVTHLAHYESNAPDLATTDHRGVVRALDAVGEATITVRFSDQVAIARLLIPSAKAPPAWDPPPSDNLIDHFVFGRLRSLNLAPAGVCTDGEFARRASLDICGVLPTPEEVAELESSPQRDKRTRWVERLLQRPEYADLFAMQWAAILRNQRSFGAISQPGTFAFHAWIRQALAENKPYDRFVSAIVTARGDATFHPPVVWYRQAKSLEEQVDDTARSSSECGSSAGGAITTPPSGGDRMTTTASPHSSAGSAASRASTRSRRVYTSSPRAWPRTRKRIAAINRGSWAARRRPASARRTTIPVQVLVDWMRRPENPYFAAALVNRYWKHFFGRGLIEPEDDLRISNPPTHPELLQALANDFVGHGFDLRRLVRTIVSSRTYDRSSLPGANVPAPGSAQHFGRFAPRRLPAEVLLDAIGTVTGVPEAFAGLPRSLRATQLPDEGFASRFLDVFGRPERASVCECERRTESTLAQSLLLLSSAEIERALEARGGRIDGWLSDPRPDAVRVAELYHVCYARGTHGRGGVPSASNIWRTAVPENASPGVRGPDLDLDQHEGIPV